MVINHNEQNGPKLRRFVEFSVSHINTGVMTSKYTVMINRISTSNTGTQLNYETCVNIWYTSAASDFLESVSCHPGQEFRPIIKIYTIRSIAGPVYKKKLLITVFADDL